MRCIGLLVVLVSFAESRPHLNFKLHGIGPDYALPQLLPKREADIVEKEPTVEQSVKSNGRTWREDDYVSSRKPPPGFEKWLDYASTHQCHMGSYKQIEANLEAFMDPANPDKLKITKEQIKGASDMIWATTYTVSNGTISHAENDRIVIDYSNKFYGLVQRFAHMLPDMQFVVSAQDEPRVLPGEGDLDEKFAKCDDANKYFTERRHLHGYVNNRQFGESWDVSTKLVPLFTQTTLNGCFKDIVFPTLFGLNNNIFSPAEEAALLPWEEREPNLFWRGSSTGGGFNRPEIHQLSHRARMVKYARDKPNMDLQFTAIILCEHPVCDEMQKEYGTTGRTDQMENFKHKYLMSIDGNSFVSRLPKFMNSGSVNFRVGMFDEWFDAWIREDEHYIRVDLDFGNLEDKLRWAIENDDKARLIGLQAREFAKNRLRNEDMECYMFRLLLEYAAICE